MAHDGRHFVKGAYALGIAVDGAEAVLLAIGFFKAIAGGADPASVQARAVAFALMAGWTALLAWGLARPLERRGLLVLTLPVIALVLAGNVAGAIRFGEGLAARGFRIFGGALVLALFALASVHAEKEARKAAVRGAGGEGLA